MLCGHQACTCMTDAGQEYCSQQCADMAVHPDDEQRCECGHDSCTADVTNAA